jgi:VWFA-related protein
MLRFCCFSAPMLAGLLFSAALGFAQAPVPAQGTPETAATTLHANTNLVLVDVVVNDNGKAVHNLDRSRFHVFENGREQTIVSLDEHQPGAEQRENGAIRAKLAALPAHTYTNIPAYPEAPAVNVLLLDGLNTQAGDQMEVRRQMLEYIAAIPPGTQLAIFTLSSHLRQLSGFTVDPAALSRALKGAKASPQSSGLLDPDWDKQINRSTQEMASEVLNPQIIQYMLLFQADTKAYETDQRINMTLEALGNLARYLSAVPGRKNLIWFSSSFPVALDPDSTLVNPFRAMRNYSLQIQEASDLLAAARVAVYPVDARGLLKQPSLDASNSSEDNMQRGSAAGMRPSAEAPTYSMTDDRFTKEVMAERGAMQQIAAATGGKEFINTNGFKEAMANAVDNGSSYYTLAYVPAGSAFDGQFHKLQVRLDDGKYHLAYRRGYYADPPDKATSHSPEKSSLMKAALLLGAPPSTQILFSAQVLPASDPEFEGMKMPDGPAGAMATAMKGPVKRYVVSLIVDAHSLAYNDMPGGRRQAQLDFVLMAYDADGKHVNYVESTLESTPTPDEILQQAESGIRVRLLLDLPPGENSLRIAVEDLTAGRAGSLEVPVKVAAR